MVEINETHDQGAQSWVQSANLPDTDFPIQNLPLGVFRIQDNNRARIGVAIGDQILDLARVVERNLLPEMDAPAKALASENLNALMGSGRAQSSRLRKALFRLLKFGGKDEHEARACLIPMADAQMLLPAQIGDFTDFFTSIHHARRTGQISRPDAPVHPNFTSIPIAYHGRASSVVVSGIPCIRPCGQTGAAPGGARYLPTARLDFELEVGFYIGPGNELGEPVPIDDAQAHIFGLCLVNDWSARDIQRWESQPLGPFLAKSFMTSASPWVVTLEALAPFRSPARIRENDVPAISPSLTSPAQEEQGGIDISLQVLLQSERMRQHGLRPVPISQPNFLEQYWSVFQMLTHHSSNGCNLRTGDLLSSGTVSGPERRDSGCMLELTAGGAEPLMLPNGERRAFLEDGDMVWLQGSCSRAGFKRIGFGECRAIVAPART